MPATEVCAEFFEAAAFCTADFFETALCAFEAEEDAFWATDFFDCAAGEAANFFDCAAENGAAFSETDCVFLEANTFAEGAPCATDFLEAARRRWLVARRLISSA